MKFSDNYSPLAQKDIHKNCEELKNKRARYVQILAINYDDTIELVYSFMEDDGKLLNFNVEGLAKDTTVESISDIYYEAFVCENEIHDLFGIKFSNLKLDFNGKFFSTSKMSPMTIISPEEIARREKEAKIAAAKAKKIANQASSENDAKSQEEV